HFFSAAVLVPGAARVRTRFWAPGPGTALALAQALAARGLGAEQIDAPAADASQFDSEALWPVVAPQLRPGHRVLIVRGASPGAQPEGHTPTGHTPTGLAGQGRDWLIQQCQAAGVRVEACAAYERRAPALSPDGLALLRAATRAGSVWLFSSSEALAHLRAIAPDTVWKQASALATHPRIVATARAAGFGHVLETRPALPDVLRALESGWSRP
ncbi:MAG: uroporphyrinogen-III synthase, partial [Hydrogenophaga sp.]